MRRFDNLKAACAGFVEPACSIFDVVGHHAPVARKSFADSRRVTVTKSFNDHEEHAEESIQILRSIRHSPDMKSNSSIEVTDRSDPSDTNFQAPIEQRN